MLCNHILFICGVCAINTINGYRLNELIYESGRSSIYRATYADNGQTYIVKLFRAQSEQNPVFARWSYEYEIIKPLNIDGIIKTYSIESYQDTYALILEDIGGISLREYLKTWTFDMVLFLRISIQIAKTLGQLHLNRIIHQDIKPDNMIIQPDTGMVKLIDFGSSTRLSRGTVKVYDPNHFEGTLSYMSPEQTGRMNRAVDYRTDLYSLGVTMYELLTGRTPFQSNDAMELIYSHIAKKPTAPHLLNPAIPLPLSNIVLKCMEKMAEDRYLSAYGLQTDLEYCLTSYTQNQIIETFPLGRKDRAESLQVSQKLYGRESEIHQLLMAFERVSIGNTEFMLVSGYEGTGKSSIVQELHKSLIAKHGFMASGKFNPFKREVPYYGFIQAFRELIRQLLAETEEKIEGWRLKFQQALGSIGQLMIDVIPELELIIGNQPPVPELLAEDAKNRFQRLFLEFVRVLMSKEHPLCIFLDDLQWIDQGSLGLMKMLLQSGNSHYLFFIGAYRDNETDSDHILLQTVDELCQGELKVTRLTVGSLGLPEVTSMLADTLQMEPDAVVSLSEMILRKTGGNPFFLTQYLNALYEEGLFLYDTQSERWVWDAQQIEKTGATENVIDLLAKKLEKLTPEAQHVLKIASCFGNPFKLQQLADLSGKSWTATMELLAEAIQEGMIVSSDGKPAFFADAGNFEDSCQFMHDRLQQATYSLMEKDDRKRTHLAIGRMMLEQIDLSDKGQSLFDIVHHLNEAAELLTELKDRLELAELNAAAGKKAKASSAFEAAHRYLTIGRELLPSDPWRVCYELTYMLYAELSDCEYIIGQMDEAVRLMDEVLQHARTPAEKLKIYCTKILLYTNRSKQEEAVLIGWEALTDYGVTPPASWAVKPAIAKGMAQIQWRLRGKSISQLAEDQVETDPALFAKIELLNYITLPLLIVNKEMMLWVVLQQVMLFLKHGPTPNSANAYAIYGLILTAMGLTRRGYQFGKLATVLSERHRLFHHAANLTFGFGILPFTKHVRESLPIFKEAYHASIEAGQLISASYAANFEIEHAEYMGVPLEEIKGMQDKYKDFPIFYNNDEINVIVYYIVRQSIRNLSGEAEDPFSLDSEYATEEQLTPKLKMGELAGVFYRYKSQLCYLFGSYKDALEACATGIERVELPTPFTVDLHFFRCLSIARLYDGALGAEKNRFHSDMRRSLSQLKRRAKQAPDNYLCRYLLAQAEWCRLHGQDQQAFSLYQKATDTAEQQGYRQVAAIANECAGLWMERQGNHVLAEALYRQAYQGYRSWGAAAKAKQLTERIPVLQFAKETAVTASAAGADFFHTTTYSRTTGALTVANGRELDLQTVMKAAQAISEEIILESLMQKLMHIVLENAGAESGCLILPKDDTLLVEAYMDAQGDYRRSPEAIPVESDDRLSKAIVQYAHRTREVVILNDAANEGIFKQDADVAGRKLKSILCVPVLYQGKLVCIIYLENNLSSGVFTPERVEVLRLLSSQLAISMENAKLYANLDEKVRERTRELQEALEKLKAAQSQLVQNEKMASLGLLTAGIAHEINNPINFVSSNVSPLKRDIADVKEVLDAYQRLVQDKGLVKEFEEIEQLKEDLELNYVIDEIDKLMDGIEEGAKRTAEIVKDLRNFSRLDEDVLKKANVEEGLDSTLSLLRRKIEPKIKVFCSYANVPEIDCNPGKLNQVFMNIMTNAVQAMPDGGELHIRTETLGDRIVIGIRDTGMGMTEAVRNRIFDPFFTTKDVGEGTGLGLSITFGIIEKHKGTIEVITELGIGTEFVITLPIQKTGAQTVQVAEVNHEE